MARPKRTRPGGGGGAAAPTQNPSLPNQQEPAPKRALRNQKESNASSIAIENSSTPINNSSSANVKPKMHEFKRRIKVKTTQKTIEKESPMPDFPMKEWSVSIYLLDQDGNELPATCFVKVTYNLHPSFENPNQTFHEPPFICKNEGWGEFEMSIDLFTTEKGGKINIFHDLNFQSPSYETIQTVVFKNPSQALINILRESGPVSADDDSKASKAGKSKDAKKRKGTFDYEKMANGLTKLNEDELLNVIQMIHDHKTPDTYTKNDMEAGEFSVDLFTLPDPLAKMIWDYLVSKVFSKPAGEEGPRSTNVHVIRRGNKVVVDWD